jgi:hypothetical protein
MFTPLNHILNKSGALILDQQSYSETLHENHSRLTTFQTPKQYANEAKNQQQVNKQTKPNVFSFVNLSV